MSGRLQTFSIVALALIAFVASLGFRAIATSHEARVAQTAREMAAVGWPWSARLVDVAPVVLRHPGGTVRLVPDESAPPIHLNPWMVPLLKGEIRLQKPPLPYWCDAFLFRLIGFSEWSARLTPALPGALATWLVYGVARTLLGPRRAIYATLAWLSMGFIPETYRLAMADPYLAFFTLLCMWAWIGRRRIRNVSGGNDWAFVLIFYASLGLGLLSKGPPLFVHLAIAIGAYHLCFWRRAPGTILSHAVGIVLVLAIALPWPLHVLAHVPNAIELWRYQSVGEITDNVENARVWWFYLPNLPTLFLPWVVVAGIGCLRTVGPGFWKRRGRLFPIFWLGATVFFFTCVHLKKNPYLLPMMPAAALLVGQGMGAVLAAARRTRFTGWPGFVIGFHAFLGIGLSLGMPALGYHFSREHELLIAIAVVTLAVAIVAVVASRDHAHIQRWVFWQTTAYVLLGLIFSRFIIAPQDNARAARALGKELGNKSRQGGYALVVNRLPEEVAVYLPLSALRQRPLSPHQLVVVENHHDPATLERWFPGQNVLMTSEFPLESTKGDSHWKVYDVWVEPRNYARNQ